MELQQLTYFLAVADEGSFTRGAQRVHVVQSTVSAAIGRLEHELGQALFRRIGHRIELTAAGDVLLLRARSIVQASHDVVAELDSLDGTLHGTVTLATVLSTGTFDFADALARIRREHPGIRLRVEFSPLNLDRHLERVLDGTFDLALIPRPDTGVAGIELQDIGQLDLLPVVSLDHPLTSTPVGCDVLASVPFIDFPPTWSIRVSTDQLFARHDLVRDVTVEVVDPHVALDLVRAGLGVAFLPRSVVEDASDVRVVALDEPLLTRPLALARPDRRQSPAVEAVHHMLLAHPSSTARTP